MAINTAALKTFAPAMRRQLLEAVGRKLDLRLNSQTPDTLSTYAKQIAELRDEQEKSREQLLERVAYTWFNRLCALRYLDAKGWHPFGCKVLMPADGSETQPELLKLMRSGSLPDDLKAFTNEQRLNQLLDGQIPTAIPGGDAQGEVYRELVLAACRSYHNLLPDLFEGLDDASELLLPDDLLTEGSIAGSFRSSISDSDCEDVEIIGWLYQFYISEKKDEVMARKKVVPTEDIPAVTQLFTPHWIVRYLVENSLGRLWILNRPSSKLREHMTYYIEGDAETDFLVINKPEEIKLLDPACGGGHMLTYAFDLLVLIYEEEGYSPNEIPGLILRHNLHGLEICPRAAQLAGLALGFKAREKSRRFFRPDQLTKTQIIELQDVQFNDGELNDYIEALDIGELFDSNLFKLLHQFEEAKNFGSLIQPCLDRSTIVGVRRVIEAKELHGKVFLRLTHLKVLQALKQAEVLTQSYQVVVANPPYQEQDDMNARLRVFIDSNYQNGSADLCCAFMFRNRNLTYSSGFVGMITMQSWMFLVGSSALRDYFTRNSDFDSMLHLGPRAFDSIPGEVVQTTAFVFASRQPMKRPKFFRLVSGRNEREKEELFLSRHTRFDKCRLADFRKIKASPFAYWASEAVFSAFEAHPAFSDSADPCQGLSTGDTPRFLRYWHEVSQSKSEFHAASSRAALDSGKKWFPINKGGPPRRWFGNNDFIVNWFQNGEEVRNLKTSSGKQKSYPRNSRFYFDPGVTWTKVSSGPFASRLTAAGFIFSDAGMKVFAKDEAELRYIACFLNSRVANFLLGFLSETINYEQGNLARLPLARVKLNEAVGIALLENARADWDNFEASWDFSGQPLLRPELKGATLEVSWRKWEAQSIAAIRRMQVLETENNRVFISAYGLECELQPEVPEEQITLARAEPRKDLAAFLSYATGCIMGRYSLDHPGLILADSRSNQDEQLAAYEDKIGKPISEIQFKPDPDGIIPVFDGEWFEDDIVARTREFLKVTFPESSVAENLRFIEESIGKDIRKYFCKDFYKDHLQTYKKRPIYWMVQSPKAGFACLIYLHRYTPDTLLQVLNNYFRPYLQKLEARQEQLERDQSNDALPKREQTAARKEAEKITKVLKECQAWEQDALLPLAQQRIELDLDDGVKVNYLKLQEVLAKIPGLAAKGS